MPQITKGDTFSNGEQVTGARLNQLVDQATILPAIITDQANLDTGTLASDDSVLIVDASESGLREAKSSDLVGSNLPVVTSSITGQPTQVSVTTGTNPTVYYNTSDITITPNDSALVTNKAYNSADSSTIVVTSTSHGLSAGQLVQTSSASTSSFNGTFRIVAANADTFTYTIPLSVLPSSGTFSSSNGTLVTVTTAVAHGLTTGNSVAFVTSNSAFNITATITVVNSTQFTYSLTSAYGTGSGSFSSSDNQYTVVTTSTNHNLVTGTSLAFTASNTGFSGTYPVTSLTPTTFAYSLGSAYGSATATLSYVSKAKIVTITKTAHGLTTGQTVIVTCTSGTTDQNNYFSGTYSITVVDVNTFTYNKTSSYTSNVPPNFTLSISYVLSGTTTGTVTYALGGAYTGNISYTASPTGASGTLSYKKKGIVRNTNNKVINGNLYVDGTTTLNSDTRFVGNMTNFGSVTQNGAVIQNGAVTITGSLNITGSVQRNGQTWLTLYDIIQGVPSTVNKTYNASTRYTFSARWYETTGYDFIVDSIVVPSGEKWIIDYTANVQYDTDDGCAMVWTLNNSFTNNYLGFVDSSTAGNFTDTYRPVSYILLPVNSKFVLSSGTYSIKLKGGIFGGSGTDYLRLECSNVSRMIYKYKTA